MKIAILGDFDISDNYPNTKHLLAAIEKDERFDVVVKTVHNRQQRILYGAGKNPLQRLVMLGVMVWRALSLSWKLISLRSSYCEVVYVPYPATFLLFCFSLWPFKSKHRPLIVMDCFISLYDTVVSDRKLLASGSRLARLLHRIEGRAIGVADAVITDTVVNADFLQQLFGGDRGKFHAINLCINESLFCPTAASVKGRLTVLFVGSFVPLQGAEVVVKAAIELSNRKDIHFQLVGDGQTADAVKALIGNNVFNLSWDRKWRGIEEIALLYGNADICLGVFGDSDKAARVLPYKVYMALACGKPVISRIVDDGVMQGDELPLFGVAANNPSELAGMIAKLADSPALRQTIGIQARRYYEKNLSNGVAISAFFDVLNRLQPL